MLGAPGGSTLPSGSSASLFLSLYNGGDSSDTLISVTAPGWPKHFPVRRLGHAPREAAPVDLTGPEPEVVLRT